MPHTVDLVASELSCTPVIGILRGLSPERTVELASQLWQSGINLVEVPLHSPAAKDSFLAAHVTKASYPNARLGVGSVRSIKDYRFARELGADFTVSPGLFPDVCDEVSKDQFPHVPGVFTPTELGQALGMGFATVKLFPASILGPAGLKALLDPFPEARIVAVGGVDESNAAGFLRSGAIGIGIGSGLYKLSERLPSLVVELSTTIKKNID